VEPLRRLLAGETGVYTAEKRYVHKDGHPVWTRLTVSLRRDAAGVPQHFISVIEDITERRALEAAVRESESRYRRAERGTHDGLWEWNVSTGDEYFAPRWLSMLGYAAGDLPGRVDAFAELVHPDDRAHVWAVAEQHLQVHGTFDLEMRLRCKDGGYLWVRSRGEAERDAMGRPTRMTGSITDISRSKAAETALENERDRLRQILDSQFGLVAVLSPDGVIVEVNQTPLTLMGLTRADVLGQTFGDIGWLDRAAMPQVRAAITAAAQGELVRGDIIARFNVAGRRDVDAIFSPIRDAAGAVVGIVAFGVDVTERKQAEVALRASEARYRRLHETMRDAFVQVDMAGRIVEFNPAYRDMLGYAGGELGALTYQDLTPERWHELEAGLVREQILPRGYSEV